MAKLLQELSANRRNSIRMKMARKDAEITALKAEVSKLYAQNNKLGQENRKLSIRNAEVTAAYNSLKEILRKRGVQAS